MNPSIDQEKLKIPAFMRKKAIVRQAKQQLILTALDRKLAGLGVHSKRALAPISPLRTQFRLKKDNILRDFKKKSRPDRPKAFVSSKNGMDLTNQQSIISENLFIVPVGKIIDYYDKIQVAVIKLYARLKLDELIQITAKDLLFQQRVSSMQINRKPVKIARKNSDIGIKVFYRPQINGVVYKVIDAKDQKAAIDMSTNSSEQFEKPLF